MKRSAGILVYRFKKKQLEVFLEHLGGPYWKDKMDGSWSIPKGEYQKERAIDAAIREFFEESGFLLRKEDLLFLGSLKQKSNKLVSVFICYQDFDASTIKSNTFTLEWPPKSGEIKTFPEMDQAECFPIEVAKKKILKGQVLFLEKLEQFIKHEKSRTL